MLSPLRNRFGIPGVISVIALVFAMFGGAYAASNSAGGGKATASAKAKRGPRGPRGATGPVGPQGPAGPKGDVGVAGSNGAPGQSVTGTAIPAGNEECAAKEGGVKYTSASGTNAVCNGKKGANGTNGKNGSPWTLGGTLPSSSAEGCPCTETGTWSFVAHTVGESQLIPISFTIPLAAPLANATECGTAGHAECQVHYIDANGMELNSTVGPVTSTVCLGNAGKPEAKPGNLCVYNTEIPPLTSPENENIRPSGVAGLASTGASTAGAVLGVSSTVGKGYGTWAVTAP